MIAVALALVVLLGLAANRGRSAGPPCKPGDCDTCPFPPCNAAERQQHMKGH